MVLRVTGGMFAALASSAPEPTMIVTAAPPIRSGRRRRGEAGTPVLFAGSRPETPAEPDMADGVRKPGLPDVAEGIGDADREGTQQEDVAAGRQHDRTQVGGHRHETILQFAGPQVGTILQMRFHSLDLQGTR